MNKNGLVTQAHEEANLKGLKDSCLFKEWVNKLPLPERFFFETLFCDSVSFNILKQNCGTSLAVQWLGFHTSAARGTSSIPDQGTKIPHAKWGGQK